MKIIVLKFGGTSVGNLEKIVKVAKIIVSYVKKKYKVIVVSSAMSGFTNELLSKTKKISKNFPNDEKDVILSTGEQISCALIAGKLNELGHKSRSWLGWQLPIITRGNYNSSRIIKIQKTKIINYLKKGGVPIVAGFQGVNSDFRITTLERGGSDTSAVALCAALNAERCDIFTDVDGIYTTDPRICARARKLEKISYEEMLELASLGAKVLQTRSVELATRFKVRLRVLSSFTDNLETQNGTYVCSEGEIMENKVIAGVAFSRDEAKVTITGIEDRPGIAAIIFSRFHSDAYN